MAKNSICVLLVDDDAAYAAVVKHLLLKFLSKPFTLRWVASGEQALRELQTTGEVDIVLMDYFLQEENGVEVAKRLSERNISVPIIFLTNHKDFKVAVEAMKYGVEDYLVKDEAMESVLPRSILNVLDRVRVRKQHRQTEKHELLAEKRAEAIHELIVAICHEFNNPLASIRISLDILSRQQRSDEQRALLVQLGRNIEVMEKNIQKLRQLQIKNEGSAS